MLKNQRPQPPGMRQGWCTHILSPQPNPRCSLRITGMPFAESETPNEPAQVRGQCPIFSPKSQSSPGWQADPHPTGRETEAPRGDAGRTPGPTDAEALFWSVHGGTLLLAGGPTCSLSELHGEGCRRGPCWLGSLGQPSLRSSFPKTHLLCPSTSNCCEEPRGRLKRHPPTPLTDCKVCPYLKGFIPVWPSPATSLPSFL